MRASRKPSKTGMNRPVLFDHLPKCGGSSITSLLAGWHPWTETLFLDGTDIDRKCADFRALPEKQRKAIRLITGHGAGKFREFVGDDFFYVTVLREPVSRVVSFIHYARRTKAHYLHEELSRPGNSIDEFLADPPTLEIQNFVTSHFSQMPAWRCAREPQVTVDLALAALTNHFDLVGAVERIDAFVTHLRECAGPKATPLRSLARALGLLPRLALPHENSGRSAQSDASPQPSRDLSLASMERIRELNQADILLLQKIDELRVRDVAPKRCRFV